MAFSLTLLPLESPEALYDRDGFIPFSQLEVKEGDGLIAQVFDASGERTEERIVPLGSHIQTQALPDHSRLVLFDDEGIQELRTNPFGDAITWAPAKEFKKLVVTEDMHPFNRALKAYIDQLPDDLPIVAWLR